MTHVKLTSQNFKYKKLDVQLGRARRNMLKSMQGLRKFHVRVCFTEVSAILQEPVEFSQHHGMLMVLKHVKYTHVPLNANVGVS